MYDKLTTVIDQTSIWDGSRRDSHAFLLSPSVYQVTKNQVQELERLGIALNDCLAGLSHIAVIAYDTHVNYGGVWALARRIFSTGVPKIYQELQGCNIRHIPRLLKVDFMVDHHGNFKIAEIDGHNKHGLGYSTLAMLLREAVHPHARTFRGAVHTLAQEVKRLGYTTIKLFYADQERFYIPEFQIAAQEFAKHGITCLVVSEMDADDEFVSEGLFLDLPFLYHKTGLYDTIITAYKTGRVEFIIPPKPFMGAKGLLALLRNDGDDDRVEALLRTFIRTASLNLVRQYIPPTFLVGKQATEIALIHQLVSQQRYVLKESISSGMKGTVFSDDPSFEAVLKVASSTNLNWILQEEVANQPQAFSWFDPNGQTLHTSEDWFMRVTVQYVNRLIGDIVVTARRDKAVHGAKDCLQLGTVIV